MSYKARIAASVAYFLFISISFTLIVNGDKLTIKNNKSKCPSSCNCEDEEVTCNQFIKEEFSLPEKTKIL